jgi:rhodanese-related sulfurtransferase
MLMILLLACKAEVPTEGSSTKTVEASTEVKSIDMTRFKNDREAGKVAIVVDVRTPKEYAEGHIPGAISLPLDQVSTRITELEQWKEKEIYLICESGGRSKRAASLLSEAGYRTVNIEGGTYAWRNAGYPVEQ